MKEDSGIEVNNSQNIEVTIIIPVYNEEKFIKRALDSIIDNNYPKNKLEILIFDGGSTDKTLDILREYQSKYPYIRIYKNPKKLQVYALNEGIQSAKGKYIIRCDAHAEYPSNYISELVKILKSDRNIWNVGGKWKTYPANPKSIISRAIAITLNSKLGVGISYRTYKKNIPRLVDTVPFGAWRKEDILEKIGLFDETLPVAEDFEFNVRIRKLGGKILLLPYLEIKYFARPTIKQIFLQAYKYGYFKPRVLQKHKTLGNLRQIIPLLFILTLPVSIIPYLLIYIPYSIALSIKNKNLKLALPILITFLAIHIGYGFGYIKGLIKNIFLRKLKN